MSCDRRIHSRYEKYDGKEIICWKYVQSYDRVEGLKNNLNTNINTNINIKKMGKCNSNDAGNDNDFICHKININNKNSNNNNDNSNNSSNLNKNESHSNKKDL